MLSMHMLIYVSAFRTGFIIILYIYKYSYDSTIEICEDVVRFNLRLLPHISLCMYNTNIDDNIGSNASDLCNFFFLVFFFSDYYCIYIYSWCTRSSYTKNYIPHVISSSSIDYVVVSNKFDLSETIMSIFMSPFS